MRTRNEELVLSKHGMLLKEFSKTTHRHTHTRSLLLCFTHINRQVRCFHWRTEEFSQKEQTPQEPNGVSSLKKAEVKKKKSHTHLGVLQSSPVRGEIPSFPLLLQWLNRNATWLWHGCSQMAPPAFYGYHSCTLNKCSCVRKGQKNTVWSADLPIRSHMHAGGRQADWHIRPVPFKLLLRKAPHARAHTHTEQHVVLNVNQTTMQGVQREGGDGVKGWKRREKRGWSLYPILTEHSNAT